MKWKPSKGIIVFGSGSIVSQLTQHGLIDEYQFAICPVLLGSGQLLIQGVFQGVATGSTGGQEAAVERRDASLCAVEARLAVSHRRTCCIALQLVLAPGGEALKKAGLHFRNQMEIGPGGKQIQLEDPNGNPDRAVRACWLVLKLIFR
jgi:RibD C-terminal domain